MFESLISVLGEELKKPLPGKPAQEPLRPYMPLSPQLDPPPLLKPKDGAVLALLYPVKGVPHLLLTERPQYKGAHSGQISFPGGKVEPGELLHETAVRETWEEVGVSPEEVKIMGELSKVYVWASNFNVHPFVGYTPQKPDFNPDSREVARILEAPLEMFFQPGIVKEKSLAGAMGIELMAPYFDVFDRTLWGATAMIISELMHVIHYAPQDMYRLDQVLRKR